MKRLVLTLACIIFPLAAFAADGFNFIDSLYFDTRASFRQHLNDGDYNGQFMADHFNIQGWGHVSENLTYRFRQRLNKKMYDENNMLNSLDWLCLNWEIDPKWTLTVGKTPLKLGEYEFDAVPIDVYFYGIFCSRIFQGFTLGVTGDYQFSPGQHLSLQVCNSPLSLGNTNSYAYNFAWFGHINKWWNTLWSCNLVQDADQRMINYLALGNHFVFGGLAIDLDLMNRAASGQKNFVSDYSVISKVIWSVGKWNLCAKGGYERNSSDNVDKNGKAYDVVIDPGTDFAYGGCGVEYFPLDRKTLRLHAVYFRDNMTKTDSFDIGITYRFDVIKH